MKSVVIDASAAIEALLGADEWPGGDDLHAHAGLDIEVVSVLRRMAMRDALPAHVARDALDAFAELQITRHPVPRLIPRIWTMRHDISAYDAGYVALAEALGIPMLTLDRKLARTAARYCDVVVL